MDPAPPAAASAGVLGPLVVVIIVAIPLAFVISIALLAAYRRAVIRRMRERSRPVPDERETASAAVLAPSLADNAAPVEIAVHDLPARDHPCAGFSWRTAAVHLAGALTFAAILAAANLAAFGVGFDWLVAAFLVVHYAWPAVIVIALAASASWLTTSALVIAYAAVFAGVAYMAGRGAGISASQVLSVWLSGNAEATALSLLFLMRPVRAAGPMVAALAAVAVAGAIGLLFWVVGNAAALAWVGRIGEAIGLGAVSGPAVLLAIGAAAAGVIGWLLLRRLGRAYERGAISDQSITADAVMLMFAVMQGIALAGIAPRFAAAAGAAFIAWKIVTAAGFRALMPAPGAEPDAPQLLLLRVFSLGGRSERLFTSFAKLWRHEGSISMIAGPDLATATVEPHQFLDYLSGRLRHSFIGDDASLAARLAEGVPRRDRDGRFRVKNFFCYDDTWRPALDRLAASHDVVLMDLRGFSGSSRGCTYEIGALVTKADPRRVLFLIDGTTDTDLIVRTVSDARARHVDTKAGGQAPRINLYRVRGGLGVTAARLASLAAAASRAGHPA